MERTFHLFADDALLPKGTRCVTRVAAKDVDGGDHRPGVHVVVKDTNADGRYVVATIAGAVLVVDRGSLTLARTDQLADLALRQHDFARLRRHVLFASVVGSQAWGLADAHSDEDIRGCFALPFDELTSLYAAPDEIHEGERAYWELSKLARQGLRADPNTLEALWSPLVVEETPLGARLRAERDMFSSQRVVESFGRYARAQLKKLEMAAARRACLAQLLDEIAAGRAVDEAAAKGVLDRGGGDAVHAVVRSVFDRGLLSSSSYAALREAALTLGPARLLPEEVRPKNAYNLVRLLHSCAHWIRHGAPLIVVTGPLRDELLDIKHSRISLDVTLARAAAAAAVADDLVAAGVFALPKEPAVDAVDAFVRAARRDAARVVVGVAGAAPDAAAPAASDAFVLREAPTPLPLDVHLDDTFAFLREQALRLPGPFLVVGLTGAHAYGFPSPDSDLDLKAVHAVPARALCGVSPKDTPLEHVEIYRGRELDLSSHSVQQAAQLLLKGNGNMLERLLGPCVVLRSPLGETLTQLAKRAISRRVVHHYLGFFEKMLKDHAAALSTSGTSTAKKMLYAYRVALTGVQLLREGELVTDVRPLAERAEFDISGLIEAKRSGERAHLGADSAAVARFAADAVRLRALLRQAEETSPLPPGPPPDVVDDLDTFVADVALACSRC
jgi:predicted nucleotidyltransferase